MSYFDYQNQQILVSINNTLTELAYCADEMLKILNKLSEKEEEKRRTERICSFREGLNSLGENKYEIK